MMILSQLLVPESAGFPEAQLGATTYLLPPPPTPGRRSSGSMPAVLLAGSPQSLRLWGLPRGDWSDPIPVPAT